MISEGINDNLATQEPGEKQHRMSGKLAGFSKSTATSTDNKQATAP